MVAPSLQNWFVILHKVFFEFLHRSSLRLPHRNIFIKFEFPIGISFITLSLVVRRFCTIGAPSHAQINIDHGHLDIGVCCITGCLFGLQFLPTRSFRGIIGVLPTDNSLVPLLTTEDALALEFLLRGGFPPPPFPFPSYFLLWALDCLMPFLLAIMARHSFQSRNHQQLDFAFIVIISMVSTRSMLGVGGTCSLLLANPPGSMHYLSLSPSLQGCSGSPDAPLKSPPEVSLTLQSSLNRSHTKLQCHQSAQTTFRDHRSF